MFSVPDGVDTFIVTGGRFSAKSWAVSTAATKWAAIDGHRILYTRYTNVSNKDSIDFLKSNCEDPFNINCNIRPSDAPNNTEAT